MRFVVLLHPFIFLTQTHTKRGKENLSICYWMPCCSVGWIFNSISWSSFYSLLKGGEMPPFWWEICWREINLWDQNSQNWKDTDEPPVERGEIWNMIGSENIFPKKTFHLVFLHLLPKLGGHSLNTDFYRVSWNRETRKRTSSPPQTATPTVLSIFGHGPPGTHEIFYNSFTSWLLPSPRRLSFILTVFGRRNESTFWQTQPHIKGGIMRKNIASQSPLQIRNQTPELFPRYRPKIGQKIRWAYWALFSFILGYLQRSKKHAIILLLRNSFLELLWEVQNRVLNSKYHKQHGYSWVLLNGANDSQISLPICTFTAVISALVTSNESSIPDYHPQIIKKPKVRASSRGNFISCLLCLVSDSKGKINNVWRVARPWNRMGGKETTLTLFRPAAGILLHLVF